MDASDICVVRYRDLQNVKLVGAELGIPWQTVYSRLKRAGEPVTGDKSRYGSETDRLSARAERYFQALVPEAEDQNQKAYQSKVDFIVSGQSVDVKVSRPRLSPRGVSQWCWSVKKQEAIADYFVCIALGDHSDDPPISRLLLIPGDLSRHYQSIRISHANGWRGKWAEYALTPSELRTYFKDNAP